MRLNFSGVSDDDIREGVRRIGEVVREQVGLYGTLTGAAARAGARARARRPRPTRTSPTSCTCPRRPSPDRRTDAR